MGVALRAAHSAAPEPRLRRVSAIRLQSLTRGSGDPLLPHPSRQLSPPSLTAVRPEQSVIAVGELAIAVSVAPSGPVRRHQRDLRARRTIWCWSAHRVARRAAPRTPSCHSCNALGRASSRGTMIRPLVRITRQASHSRGSPRLPPNSRRGSAGEWGRGRCADEAVRLALSSSAASKDAVLAPVSIGLTEAPIPPTD